MTKTRTTTAQSLPAEVLKLAHQLGVPPQRLEFLAELPSDDLGVLRRQIADALFEADRHHFAKIAAASQLLPAAVAAKVTEHALSPVLAARTAELLDASRAVDMIGRLPQRYIADVSVAMDPARAPDVVAAVPPATVAAVSAELAARREWVVMGGFVSHISAPALRLVIGAMDGEQLLRVGYVLDDMGRLDDIIAMLDRVQWADLLRAAARLRLWTELDALVDASSPASRARLTRGYAEAPAEVRGEVSEALDAGAVGPSTAAVLGAA